MFNTKQSQGFTLIEMMIAMTISLVLLLGVSQIFNSNKYSQRVSEGLARVQENARFALKKISIDMRRAGYVGCAGDNLKDHLNPAGTGYSSDLFDFTKGTAGWEYTGGSNPSQTEPGETYSLASVTPLAAGDADKWQNNNSVGLPDTLSGLVVPGSDILVMKWMGDDLANIQLNGAVNPNSASIQTLLKTGIAPGTVVIISDCSGGDVFQNVAVATAKSLQRGVAGGDPGNLPPSKNNWSHAYPNGANLSTFTSRAYFIGTGVSGQPSLFSITYDQAASGQTTQEIAEGIENMQVLYGVSASTDPADVLPIKYVTAEEVADHSLVVSLKIGLIARSPEEAKKTPAAQSLSSLGTTINIPTDRKIRFVFTSTVKLRNKGIK